MDLETFCIATFFIIRSTNSGSSTLHLLNTLYLLYLDSRGKSRVHLLYIQIQRRPNLQEAE